MAAPISRIVILSGGAYFAPQSKDLRFVRGEGSFTFARTAGPSTPHPPAAKEAAERRADASLRMTIRWRIRNLILTKANRRAAKITRLLAADG
jgi:hypothetical protein